MTNKSRKTKKTSEELLEGIEKLLILQLYRDGASTQEIGKILSVSYKTIQRILPKKSKKRKKRKK
ncbi:MAG: helix-turn-helix domain-containing protein [Candidatus Nealsonbacteria bacterium]